MFLKQPTNTRQISFNRLFRRGFPAVGRHFVKSCTDILKPCTSWSGIDGGGKRINETHLLRFTRCHGKMCLWFLPCLVSWDDCVIGFQPLEPFQRFNVSHAIKWLRLAEARKVSCDIGDTQEDSSSPARGHVCMCIHVCACIKSVCACVCPGPHWRWPLWHVSSHWLWDWQMGKEEEGGGLQF